MASFLALYRGETIGSAGLLAVSADPALVADFADRMLAEPEPEGSDAATIEVERGRRNALRLVRSEAGE